MIDYKSFNILDKVGNTPFVSVHQNILGKCEFLNPGGSIKDRPIKFIIEYAEARSIIKPGDTIIEATSGNSGISLAMIGAIKGYNVKIIMPRDMSKERKKMIYSFGAELIQVEEGAFAKAISLRNELCDKNGWFTTNQFHSTLNIDCHYSTTGKEIVDECMRARVNPVAIICGTGTGGTIMGIKKALKEVWTETKVIAVEPRESPVMSGGAPGLHGIQGIGDGSKYLVDLKEVDDIIKISTKEAFEESASLARNNGLFLGISSGANSLASKRWAEKRKFAENDVVITILCDRGERYFSCL